MKKERAQPLCEAVERAVPGISDSMSWCGHGLEEHQHSQRMWDGAPSLLKT